MASPRGGQGAPAKIIVGNQWRNRVDQVPPEKKKASKAEAIEDLFEPDSDEEMNDKEGYSDADDETDDDQDRTKGQKTRGLKRLNVFSNPKRRGSDAKRAKLLVRYIMPLYLRWYTECYPENGP